MKNNLSKYILLISIFSFVGHNGFSQGTFENLNFESATIVVDPSSGYYPYAVNAADALPGWTVTGGVAAPDVLYNDISLGAPAVSLQGPGSYEPILQGNYSVFLQGSTAGMPGGVSIGQSDQIPMGSQSLLFYGAQIFNLQVSFAGQLLPYVAVGTGPNYTIYGANISAYAGDTGQLSFYAPANGAGEIDDIQFSVQAIPEPETWALILCGATLLGLSRRRRT